MKKKLITAVCILTMSMSLVACTNLVTSTRVDRQGDIDTTTTEVTTENVNTSVTTDETATDTTASSQTTNDVTSVTDTIIDAIEDEASNTSSSTTSSTSQKADVVYNDAGCFVDDGADLYTDTQTDVIISYLDGIQQFGKFGIVTLEKNPYDSTKEFARIYYSANMTDADNGLLFIIDMQYRTVFVYSQGDFLTQYITDQVSQDIATSASGALSEGNYHEATKESIVYIAAKLGCDLSANESFSGATF